MREEDERNSARATPRDGGQRIFLIRHGRAVPKDDWPGADEIRPLTDEGRAQAASLGDAFQTTPVDRILTSPAVRCRDTLEPIAVRKGLPIEEDERLGRDASSARTLELLSGLTEGSAMVCTHREVIGPLLSRSLREGVAIDGPLEWEVGSVWVLVAQDGRIVAAEPMRGTLREASN
jgi:phosphohistidine phosphatase SixA